MNSHHPSCAVTRQGDLRAYCDCKWPEVRRDAEDGLIEILSRHVDQWEDTAKWQAGTPMAKIATGRADAIRNAIMDIKQGRE